jgi:hypothetical protein
MRGDEWMPKCGACGYSNIDDSATYCPRCGELLSAGIEVSPITRDYNDDPVIMEDRGNVKRSTKLRKWSPNHSKQIEFQESPQKIEYKFGGWLYIPIVHLILITIIGVYGCSIAFLNWDIIKYGSYLNEDYYVTLFLFSGVIVFAFVDFYVLFAFLGKMARAPIYFMILLWAFFVFKLIISISSKNIDILNLKSIIYHVVSFIIIVIYHVAFSKSKRAKATFIN